MLVFALVELELLLQEVTNRIQRMRVFPVKAWSDITETSVMKLTSNIQHPTSIPRLLLYASILTCLFAFAGCQKGTEVNTASAPNKQTKQLTRAQIRMLEVAAAGDTAAVKELLDAGVDVNMRGNDNNTPIMEAAFAGKLETVKLLLDHGADLSAKKNDGETVVALGGGHADIVVLFKNVSAIVVSAGKGDNKSISELIAKGTPVNGLDQFGQSALTEAAWNGHKETVKLLLENNADPNIKKADGEPPINLARAQKHQEIVTMLEQAIAKRSEAKASADGK